MTFLVGGVTVHGETRAARQDASVTEWLSVKATSISINMRYGMFRRKGHGDPPVRIAIANRTNRESAFSDVIQTRFCAIHAVSVRFMLTRYGISRYLLSTGSLVKHEKRVVTPQRVRQSPRMAKKT